MGGGLNGYQQTEQFTLGFWPEEQLEAIRLKEQGQGNGEMELYRAVFLKTEGKVLNESGGGETVEPLTVNIDKIFFDQTIKEAANWAGNGKYKLFSSDCVVFIQRMATLIGLDTPSRSYGSTRPGPFVTTLAENNAYVADKKNENLPVCAEEKERYSDNHKRDEEEATEKNIDLQQNRTITGTGSDSLSVRQLRPAPPSSLTYSDCSKMVRCGEDGVHCNGILTEKLIELDTPECKEVIARNRQENSNGDVFGKRIGEAIIGGLVEGATNALLNRNSGKVSANQGSTSQPKDVKTGGASCKAGSGGKCHTCHGEW